MSDSLRPHGLQNVSLPCPSPSPGVCSDSCPLSWWCHPPSQPLSSCNTVLETPFHSIAHDVSMSKAHSCLSGLRVRHGFRMFKPKRPWNILKVGHLFPHTSLCCWMSLLTCLPRDSSWLHKTLSYSSSLTMSLISTSFLRESATAHSGLCSLCEGAHPTVSCSDLFAHVPVSCKFLEQRDPVLNLLWFLSAWHAGGYP